MISQARIQNLGKLADATIRIRPLTVLAGANNTGKSFFSKGVYSVCHAMNADHLRFTHSFAAGPVDDDLQKWGSYILGRNVPEWADIISADKKIGQARSMANKVASNVSPLKEGVLHPACYDESYPDLVKAADLLDAAFAEFKTAAEQCLCNANEASDEKQKGWDFLHDMEKHVNWLGEVWRFPRSEFVGWGLMKMAEENMLKNFQVATMSGLQGRHEEGVRIRIPEMGIFYFSPGQQGYKAKLIPEYYSRVVYLDSPAFWRVQIGLRNARRERKMFSSNGREEVDGIPKYFYDLDEMLDRTLTGDVPFPQVVERIADVIGGKIVRDPFGVMEFVETDGRRVPLPATAMGVANLGVLALAIEKKLVDKNALLFIDEPESNLHPEWQVKMTEALWELARGGVNVVIATHGVDILKRLDIYAEEKETKEEAANLIAVNHFRSNGTVQSGGVEKILDVQEDLSTPFFELYKRGLAV